MKIAAVACFSNERAIAGAFRDQLETFFDKSYLVAHNSYDKTEKLFLDVEKYSVTKAIHVDFRQAEYALSEMKKAFAEGADWVVFLDFDEFLPFIGRRELEDFLDRHREEDVISWNWQNILPETWGDADLFKKSFLTIYDIPSLSKTIISKSAFEKDPDLLISHGAHNILSSRKLKHFHEVGHKLIHIPIHGLDHFKQKIIIRKIHIDFAPFITSLLERYLIEGTFDDDQLRELALNYSSTEISKAKAEKFVFDFPYVKSKYLFEKDSAIDALIDVIHTYILEKEQFIISRMDREIYNDKLISKAIMQTRSWKITRPLRAANSYLQKIKSLKP